jgi:hypothetical protein
MMSSDTFREPREAHCQCCGGYAGYGADPEYCANCRRAGEHLRYCKMCEERVPFHSIEEFCTDCSETIDELDRYADTSK